MTDEAKSPLRRRMIEDMTIRKFALKSQRCVASPGALPRERFRSLAPSTG